MHAQRLCKQRCQGEESEDEHRQHTAGIGVHPLLVHKNLGQITAADGHHGHYQIKGENQRLAQAAGGGSMELVAEVARSPEQEEPPDAVGEKLAHNETPGLTVFKALQEGNRLLFGSSLGRSRLLGSLFGIVLMDIFQLGGIHLLAVLGLVVHKGPEEHPDETQTAYNDEGHLPAELHGQRRNYQRCCQGTYRCTCIENGSSKGAVFLGEIFRRDLDGGGEVARLAQRQYAAAQQEQIYRRSGDSQGNLAARLNGTHSRYAVQTHDTGGCPAAQSVQAGACAPHANRNQISLLGPHPVHKLARKQAADGIKDREEAGDGAVVGVGPVEFGLDELLVGERKHLTVQIVHRGGHKQQAADPPAPVGHKFLLSVHILLFTLYFSRLRAYPLSG